MAFPSGRGSSGVASPNFEGRQYTWKQSEFDSDEAKTIPGLHVVGEGPDCAIVLSDGTSLRALPQQHPHALYFKDVDLLPREVVDELHAGSARPVQPGRCASFDGVDDYVDLTGAGSAFNFSTQQAFSFGCWYRISASDSDAMVINKRGTGSNVTKGYHLRPYGGSGQLEVRVADGTNTASYVTPSSTVPADTWVHAFGVYDGLGTVTLYVNGLPVGSNTNATMAASAVVFDDAPLTLGALNILGFRYHLLTGKLFDVRIYNRALTAEEIASIYSTSKPGGHPEVALFAADLVGHWKLDDTVATKRDSSGNGYHGTQGGGVTIYTGNDVPFSWQNEVGYTDTAGDLIPQNSAIPSQNVLGATLQYAGPVPRNAKLIDSHCGTFDGVDDVGTCASIPAITGSFSISAWVYWTGTQHQTIAGRYDGTNGYILYLASSGALSLYMSNGTLGYYIGPSIPSNQWVHLAGTWNGSVAKLYINGVDSAATPGGTPANPGAPAIQFTIGAFNGTSGRFAGRLNEVRLYNSALSAGDVANLYQGNEITAQPVGHWPIAEGDGATLYDVSGNGNHATLTGISASSFWGNKQNLNHRNIKKGFTANYNLVRYSQDLEHSDWSKVGAGTISANSVIAPDGTMTADRLTASDTTFVYQSFPFVNGYTYTLSFWAKAAAATTIQYGNLIAGAALGNYTTSVLTPSWMRYEFTYVASNTPLNNFIQRLSGGNDIDIWGIQLVRGSAAKDYQRTTAARGRVPAINNGTRAADGSQITNPAGPWHNGAETRIDFTGGVAAAPWTSRLRDGYYTAASDGMVVLSAVQAVTGDFSAFARVRPNKKTLGQVQYLLDVLPSSGRMILQLQNTNGKVALSDGTTSFEFGECNWGEWNNLLFVRKDGRVACWINGQFTQWVTPAAAVWSTATAARLGSIHGGGATEALSGDIERFRLVNGAFEPDTVLAEPALLDVHFDEPTLRDSSQFNRALTVPGTWALKTGTVPTTYAFGETLPHLWSKVTKDQHEEQFACPAM